MGNIVIDNLYQVGNWLNVGFQKISIPIPWKVPLEILRGWRVSKAKTFNGKHGGKMEFWEGRGKGLKPKPSLGDIWIFSGTMQWNLVLTANTCKYVFDMSFRSWSITGHSEWDTWSCCSSFRKHSCKTGGEGKQIKPNNKIGQPLHWPVSLKSPKNTTSGLSILSWGPSLFDSKSHHHHKWMLEL